MTLPKAIEIMELNLKEAGSKMPPDCRDAVQLSINTMKWRKEVEEKRWLGYLVPLPGQTAE